ncbi:transcription repressor OFP2-like [Salvia divinorum]|uniref:Transcription repressor n=1 Tax=Salvia divinorum TaxID=28513 RepID=A0ABD1IHY5_SALDI
MKWWTNRSPSLITRLFSKFNRNPSKKTNTHYSNVLDFPSPNSSFYRDEGRFYSFDEDDPYWRISFSDDKIQPRRSTGGINPLWQEDPDMFPGFQRLGLAEAEAPMRNFSEMVSDIKRMRESRGRKQKGKERSGEDNHGAGEKRKPKFGQENRIDRRRLGDIKVKTRVRRTRASKASSPRNECKIRALEEIRKARTKAKKRAPNEGDTVFNSVVVVKSSLDPRTDFKDSMVAMILEKGIGHPDDLEDLLACYLTLNSNVYHDLIISVFTQVWVELNGDPFVKNVSYCNC